MTLAVRICVFIIVLIAWPSWAGPEQNSVLADAGVERLRAILDPYINDRLIPGYYLAIHDNKGMRVEVSDGWASEGEALESGPEVLYSIMSMSKPIVAFATLRLVEQEKLGLDDPVKNYIPTFSKLVVAKEGKLNLATESLERDVTIRDLLTHTAGLTYSDTSYGREEVSKRYRELGLFDFGVEQNLQLDEQIQALVTLPLVSQPGSRFVYSASVDVVAHILELITRQSFDSVLDELVLQPLGMMDTHLVVPTEKVSRLASMYRPRRATYPIPGKYRQYQSYFSEPDGPKNFGQSKLSTVSVGDGLVTTANDLSKFLSLLLNDGVHAGQRLVTKETVDMMFEHQLPNALGKNALVYNFGPRMIEVGFSFGLGIKLVAGGDPLEKTDHDYYFWEGAASTAFWIDRSSESFGMFLSQLYPTEFSPTSQLVEVSRTVGSNLGN